MCIRDRSFTAKEIEEQIHFQEKYYKTTIMLAKEAEQL